MHKHMPIVIIIIGLLLFGIGSLPSCEKPQTEEKTATEAQRLEELLSCVAGAGKVMVHIYYEDAGELVPIYDQDGDVVVLSRGEERIGALKEKTPRVAGVLIVAEGAGDSRVRAELITSVRALYATTPERICVLKGKSIK